MNSPSELIKEKIDIVDFIGGYINLQELEKTGKHRVHFIKKKRLLLWCLQKDKHGIVLGVVLAETFLLF